MAGTLARLYNRDTSTGVLVETEQDSTFILRLRDTVRQRQKCRRNEPDMDHVIAFAHERSYYPNLYIQYLWLSVTVLPNTQQSIQRDADYCTLTVMKRYAPLLPGETVKSPPLLRVITVLASIPPPRPPFPH